MTLNENGMSREIKRKQYLQKTSIFSAALSRNNNHLTLSIRLDSQFIDCERRTRLSQIPHFHFARLLISIINLRLFNCLLVRSHYQHQFDFREIMPGAKPWSSFIHSVAIVYFYVLITAYMCFIHFHFTHMCDALQSRNRPKTFLFFIHSPQKEGEFNSMCSTERLCPIYYLFILPRLCAFACICLLLIHRWTMITNRNASVKYERRCWWCTPDVNKYLNRLAADRVPAGRGKRFRKIFHHNCDIYLSPAHSAFTRRSLHSLSLCFSHSLSRAHDDSDKAVAVAVAMHEVDRNREIKKEKTTTLNAWESERIERHIWNG